MSNEDSKIENIKKHFPPGNLKNILNFPWEKIFFKSPGENKYLLIFSILESH